MHHKARILATGITDRTGFRAATVFIVMPHRPPRFAPPDPDGVDRAELRELVRRGQIIEEGGVYFGPDVVERAATLLAEMLDEQPDGVTVSEVRKRMGNTRKHAMPLLARLDATGMTRRRDDLRIAGPRLSQP